jgi:hypothetical protein
MIPCPPVAVAEFMPPSDHGIDLVRLEQFMTARFAAGASPGTLRHVGLGGLIQNQIADQQYPTGLLQGLNTGTLRINPRNWERMLADPRLQAMGRARIEDRRNAPSY